MNERAQKRTCKKARVVFFVALLVLVASGRHGFAFEETPAKDSSSAEDEFHAVSKEIHQAVGQLGYTDDLDINLVQMVSGWKYMNWKQMLDKARGDYQQKKISAAEVAQVEEEVAGELYQAIRKEFSPAAGDSDYFYLSKVVKDKTAQCLGYSQLLYVLGNSIGLTVKVMDVLEPAAGPLPPGEEHTACLVELTGGKVMMVDLTKESISKSFVFREQFSAIGNYWELKQNDNPLKIHRRIQILDKNGLVADIFNSLGNAYAKSGKVAEAVSLFSKAIQRNPKIAKAYSSRGAVLFSSGQNPKGITDLSKAIELDPKDADAYINLGGVCIALGQEAKALSYLTKAIELKPAFSITYKNRGKLYFKLGKNAEAFSDLSKAIELDPKDAEPYVILGVLHAQSGQFAKAMPFFSKALEVNPKYADAYNNRGSVYSQMGKYTEAISDFIKAIELNPNYAEAYLNRGLVYAGLEQNKKAIEYFTKAIEINSKYAEAYNSRGGIYIKLGKYDEAAYNASIAIRLNPKYAEAYFTRGLANAYLKRNEDAKKDLQKAMELNPALKAQIKQISEKFELGL